MAISLPRLVASWASVHCLALLLAAPVPAEVNRIVLRVNDRIVTLHDFEKRRDERIDGLRRAEQLTSMQRQELLAGVGQATFREMYEEQLILSRADQLGIRISPQEIDQAIQQTKQGFGITTNEQFQEALTSANLTIEMLREQIRSSLVVREIMGREVQPRVQLEEEDLRRYYRAHPEEFETPRQLRLEEVVVLAKGDSDGETAMELALRLREELLGGKTMEEVVEPFAEEGLTSRVVDLEWIEDGDLEGALAEAAWELQPGEFSEPVEARGGLHILHVLDRRDSTLRPFAEVQGEIDARERSGRFQDELRKYLDDLEARSFIVADPPPEAADFLAAKSGPRVDPLTGLSRAAEPVEAVSIEEGEEPETPETGPGAGEVEAEPPG